jgi:chaperone modulatory protein CbpM
MTDREELLMQFLDERGEVAFAELIDACGIEGDVLRELVAHGVFEPSGNVEQDWRFPSRALSLARRAARLRSGFELDPPALALVLDLLERMEDMQRRVRELECQLLR